MHKPLLFVVLLIGAVVGAPAAGEEPATGPEDPAIAEILAKMMPPMTLAEDLRPIKEAFDKGDPELALKLSDELIERPIQAFATEYYGWNVKSAAYDYKASALLQTGADFGIAFEARRQAILNGNYPSVDSFALDLMQGVPEVAYPVSQLSDESLAELLRVGLDFGDGFAAAAVSIGGLPGANSEDEKIYWLLFTVARDSAKPLSERKEMLAALFDELGATRGSELIGKFSVVGAPFSSSALGLPGRDAYATLFLDGDLRGTFGRGGGQMAHPNDENIVPPTIREQFAFYAYMGREMGVFTPFLLVPDAPDEANGQTISASRSEIIDALIPGDRVFVSCGPLSHVAILYRKDPASKRLIFTDPLFQFWQPTHNSCVSKLDLIEDKHRRYLSSIDDADVAGMLDAVITLRSAK